ncbi:MAG: glycosyltransferase family 2 protein [Veillonellales bacterium]
MEVSIVIPTYNEADNVRLIAERISRVLSGEIISYEILFIDDSIDNTPAILAELSHRIPQVKYRHREGEKGLASAVVAGFSQAQGSCIIVMDADLQHPPELIPLILKRLATADIVIPSRFITGGSDGGLNGFRKLVSWTARTIGRISFTRLRDISDCTGGYFGLNRSVITATKLNPIGWKILMEVLVKGHYRTVHEIPYSFAARDAGESKMSLREQWNYLRHVARLVRSSPEDRRFYAFCLVGFLGVFVNLLALRLLLNFFPLSQFAASVAASFIAMTHNFFWNDRVTWKERQYPVLWHRVLQFPQFMLVCGLGIAITALFARLFLSLGWNIYLGQLAGISVSTSWGFIANNRWTWSASGRQIDSQNVKLVVTQEYAGKIS